MSTYALPVHYSHYPQAQDALPPIYLQLLRNAEHLHSRGHIELHVVGVPTPPPSDPIVCWTNITSRITRLDNGQCIIGMKSSAMIPLISFDAVVNVYLTILFLIPLKSEPTVSRSPSSLPPQDLFQPLPVRRAGGEAAAADETTDLYSFKNMPRTPANIRLRIAAFRTSVGAACTLISSVANLSVLMALNGEPGWVCLMCCNCDSKSPHYPPFGPLSPGADPCRDALLTCAVLFSAIVIQWVTSKDSTGTSSIYSNHQLETQTPHKGSLRISTCRISSSDTDPTRAPPSPAAQALVHQRCSNGRASAASSDSPPQLDPALATPSGGGVVVTTTIRHESRPNDENLCDASDDEGSSAYNGGQTAGSMQGAYRGSRRMSVGPLGEGFISSKTRITGGGGHRS